jgi:hypothetical protein
MKQTFLVAACVFGVTAAAALAPKPASALTCANGVYRAGCAGPNGAAVVNKGAPASVSTYHGTAPVTTYHGGSVTCANGVYRAGCAGPNGAAVVRK